MQKVGAQDEENASRVWVCVVPCENNHIWNDVVVTMHFSVRMAVFSSSDFALSSGAHVVWFYPRMGSSSSRVDGDENAHYAPILWAIYYENFIVEDMEKSI